MQLRSLSGDWPAREGVGLAAGIVLGALCQGALKRVLRRLGVLRGGGLLLDDSDDEAADTAAPGSDARFAGAGDEHKLVLCVRTDLKMQKGKIAAQVGHATLGAYKAAARAYPRSLRVWEHHAQPKIALQIRSHAEARQLAAAAKKKGLVTYMVHDAGRTQIAAGSMTVLAIGPGPASVVNSVTGNLKLL